MDSKKIIKNCIGTKSAWVLIVAIVAMVAGFALGEETYMIGMLGFMVLFVGACIILPVTSNTGKTLKRLESKNLLDKAAQELEGPNTQTACKDAVVLTDNFLFQRKKGVACAYSEILWMHKHKFTRRLLFIPVYTRESLVVYVGKGSYYISLSGKDKNNDLGALLQEIYRHNNKILVGYTAENQKAYKQLRKG